MRRLTRFLGTDPFRFLVLLGSFALAWYVYAMLRAEPTLPSMLLWFFGAVIAHDALLLPLYSLGDRALTGILAPLGRRARRIPVSVNYLRLPALGSGLVFLVFLPEILEGGARDFARASGQDQGHYLGNWLLVTAVLFGLSVLLWIVRALLAQLRR